MDIDSNDISLLKSGKGNCTLLRSLVYAVATYWRPNVCHGRSHFGGMLAVVRVSRMNRSKSWVSVTSNFVCYSTEMERTDKQTDGWWTPRFARFFVSIVIESVWWQWHKLKPYRGKWFRVQVTTLQKLYPKRRTGLCLWRILVIQNGSNFPPWPTKLSWNIESLEVVVVGGY